MDKSLLLSILISLAVVVGTALFVLYLNNMGKKKEKKPDAPAAPQAAQPPRRRRDVFRAVNDNANDDGDNNGEAAS